MKKIKTLVVLAAILASGCVTGVASLTPQEKHVRKRCMHLFYEQIEHNKTIHPYERCKRLVRAQNEEPGDLFNEPNGDLFSIQFNHEINYINQ